MDVVVCASCPEMYHDEAEKLCERTKVLKAFGKAGDMVNSLSGKDWVAKWETKVVMAVVVAARIREASNARILCIEGGRHCDQEVAAQPKLVRAIRQELGQPDFRIRVEWMNFEDFKVEMEKLAPKGAPAASRSTDSKPCKHFAEGKCTKGSLCGFSHATAGAASSASPTAKGSKGSSDPSKPKGGKGPGKTGQAFESPKMEDSSKVKEAKGAGKKGQAPEFAKMEVKEGKGAGKKGQAQAAAETQPVAKGAGKKTQAPPPPSAESPKLCKHFLAGACTKGASCQFLHQVPEPPAPTGQSERKPCKHFAAGGCKNGDKCAFSHTSSTSHNSPTKAAECKNFAAGNCKNGDKCAFSHAVASSQKSTSIALWTWEDACSACKKSVQGPIARCKQCYKSCVSGGNGYWLCLSCHERRGELHPKSHKFELHRDYDHLQCKGCKKTFEDESALVQHQQAKNHKGVTAGLNLGDFMCSKCLECCLTKKAAAAHAATGQCKPPESDSSEDVWPCPACDRDFASERAREQHMESTGHAFPQCFACRKLFMSERALEQHCESTGHFAFASNLMGFVPLPVTFHQVRNPVEVVQDTRDGGECLACNQLFTSGKALQRHYATGNCLPRSRPLEVLPNSDQTVVFQCNDCPTWVLSMDWPEHMRATGHSFHTITPPPRQVLGPLFTENSRLRIKVCQCGLLLIGDKEFLYHYRGAGSPCGPVPPSTPFSHLQPLRQALISGELPALLGWVKPVQTPCQRPVICQFQGVAHREHEQGFLVRSLGSCDTLLNTEEEMRRHTQVTGHGLGAEDFVKVKIEPQNLVIDCQECKRLFLGTSTFFNHVCPCPRDFRPPVASCRSDLQLWEPNQEHQNKVFICNSCSKFFLGFESCMEHSQNTGHQDVAEPPREQLEMAFARGEIADLLGYPHPSKSGTS